MKCHKRKRIYKNQRIIESIKINKENEIEKKENRSKSNKYNIIYKTHFLATFYTSKHC